MNVPDLAGRELRAHLIVRGAILPADDSRLTKTQSERAGAHVPCLAIEMPGERHAHPQHGGHMTPAERWARFNASDRPVLAFMKYVTALPEAEQAAAFAELVDALDPSELDALRPLIEAEKAQRHTWPAARREDVPT